MKILVIASLLIGSVLGFTCPPDVKEPVYFSDPDNCRVFYVCLPGATVGGYCGGDLVFDDELNQCAPKDQVDCHGRPSIFFSRYNAAFTSDLVFDEVQDLIEMTSAEEGTENSHCPANSKPGQFQLVPHETDCDKFYMCMGPKETLKTCRPGQLFNKQKHRCDKAENVDCNAMTTVAPNQPEVKHCPENSKPGKFQLVPHETDCDKFYMCMGPKETLKTCRPGQLFNPQKHRCDKAENVDCGQVTTVSSVFEDFTETEDHCPEDTDPKHLVRVAHETDCDKYWLCYNKKEKLRTCKEGKLFSEKRNHCLTADKVECGDRTTAAPEPTTSATEEPETESPFNFEGHCPENNTRVVRVAHETDCDKYWLCAGPNEKLKQCKEGKLFSTRANVCRKADKVDCGDRTTVAPTTTQETPTEVPEPTEDSVTVECPNNHKFELLPHPESCKKFFVCRNREAYEKECRENYEFDPTKKRCVKAEQSQCQELLRGDKENPLKPTMTAVENSCRKFVFQFQYRKYNFECKEGFWFHPEWKHCSKDREGVCAHEKPGQN